MFSNLAHFAPPAASTFIPSSTFIKEMRVSRTCGRRPFTRNHLTSFKECHYFPPNWAKQVISKKHWTKNSWKYRSSDVLKNFQNLVYSCCLTQFGGPARSLKPLDGASVHFTEGSRNLLSYYVLLARFTETLNIRLNDSQWLQIVKSRHKISSFDVISRVFQNNFSKFTTICVCGRWVLYSKVVESLQVQVHMIHFTNF